MNIIKLYSATIDSGGEVTGSLRRLSPFAKTTFECDRKWKVSYEVIGHPPNVAVPTHFYKVIFAEDGKAGGNVALGAFVLPNDRIPNDKPLKEFEVPIEAVERASGLEFAALLPPARRKQLCKEVSCSIIVKEYAQRQKTMMTPPPQKGALPPPVAR